MTKRTSIDETAQFTARVHKQHNSLVVTVPKGLCDLMGIKQGDILVFEHLPVQDKAILGRLTSGGWYHERSDGDSDRADKGG